MIKRILVYTYGNQSHEHTIKAAALFAAQHDADITGLFVKPDYINYTSVYGTYPLNLAQTFYDTQDSFAKNAQESFNEITSQFNCRSDWQVVDQYERTPMPTAYADYIFISQPSKDDSVIFSEMEFIDQSLVKTGLPTFVIPPEWHADEFAARPLLAWKESTEAVRAVRFTLPLMRAANKVHIATISKRNVPDTELIEGIEISNYLALHGVDSEYFCEHMSDDDTRQSDTLFRHASEHKHDLIIAGAYSHSRFREVVFGGMTRELLRNCPVPALLVH